jgi:hypothetical protein
MKERGKWKPHLLRTSVPLEHEAARVLSLGGFNVSAAYPYTRIDGGFEKEFSVDVRGVRGHEAPGSARIGCVLDVLIECKYRQRDNTWLFLPEPKARTVQLSESIQDVDLLSARFVRPTIAFKEESKVQVCYAAVEVGDSDPDENGGKKPRAYGSELRHGVRQLQYALPALLALRARWTASRSLDANFPFFFVPILLTNAKLVVAHHDFGISKVENAETLEDLGTVVSRVLWSSELGPDFDVHCQRQLATLPALLQTKNMKSVEERRKAAGLADWLQPSAVAARLQFDGSAATELAEFTNVLVVTLDALTSVLDEIRIAFEDLARSVSDTPLYLG